MTHPCPTPGCPGTLAREPADSNSDADDNRREVYPACVWCEECGWVGDVERDTSDRVECETNAQRHLLGLPTGR